MVKAVLIRPRPGPGFSDHREAVIRVLRGLGDEEGGVEGGSLSSSSGVRGRRPSVLRKPLWGWKKGGLAETPYIGARPPFFRGAPLNLDFINHLQQT